MRRRAKLITSIFYLGHSPLAPGTIGSLASQLGVSPHQASGSLAQLLPEVINHLTPAGQVPGNHADLVTQGMALLKGFAR